MEGKSYCYTLTRRGNSVSWVRNAQEGASAREIARRALPLLAKLLSALAAS
jgi:hypothetical protein